MIIRISKSGGSFLGAGKYYLHDKLGDELARAAQSGERVSVRDQSDERVWFTDTRNCINTHPERALEEMWRTAEDQAWLKQQAGVKRGGRTCEDPVKTISLSWHKDDQPEPQHMVEQADRFLKHMGWDAHQAVYVGHNDTEHRHIHIILNRINPENGRTLDDYREQKRAQVWALAYEKEHDNVRCEEREVRAAKREHRAPEQNLEHEATRAQESQPQSALRTPANDHLPHNVIEITRPMQRTFERHEQARSEQDALERAKLKADQRAEREAFFKEGAALFKATRHAVYDQVRREYAPQWREFYKESKAAEKEADDWSRNAVSRALHFARDGDWELARIAFSNKDSVRDASDDALNQRKAELKDRHMHELLARQNDAIKALLEIRTVHYQELLVRQRYERGGLGSAAEPPIPANQNQTDAAQPPAPPQVEAENVKTPAVVPSPIEVGQAALFKDMLAGMDEAISSDRGGSIQPPVVPTESAPSVSHQLTDLAAGSIGAVADYIADQLGEMFAPTPPEVRKAQAKADAKREAEKPAPEQKDNPFARQIEAAMRLIEAEREQQKDRTYWEDRDKDKGWERDR